MSVLGLGVEATALTEVRSSHSHAGAGGLSTAPPARGAAAGGALSAVSSAREAQWDAWILWLRCVEAAMIVVCPVPLPQLRRLSPFHLSKDNITRGVSAVQTRRT